MSPCWPAYIAAWVSGALSDAIILGLALPELAEDDGWGFSLVGVEALRLVLFTAASVHCLIVLGRDPKGGKEATVEETRGLLSSTHAPGADGTWISAPATETEYGSSAPSPGANDDNQEEEDEDDREIRVKQRKRLEEAGGWLGYLKTLLVFLPLILPYKHRPTQMWILVLILCIGAQRFLTYMVPRQFSILTEAVGRSTVTGTYASFSPVGA